MIPYGVHRDMSPEVYHKLPCISASLLKKFHNTTDAHAKVAIDEKWEPSPEAIIGTLAHQSILEPDKDLPKLAVQPDTYTNDKGEVKPWHNGADKCKTDRAKAIAEGKTWITKDDKKRWKGIVAAVLAHDRARSILECGRSEVSFAVPANPATCGHPLKARMDFVPDRPFLLDLKTFRDVSDRGFTKDAYDRGLHIQAAFYLAVYNTLNPDDRRDGFKFIAVENQAPFCVRVFTCTPEFIARGWEDATAYMARYARCIETGVWSGYGPDEVPLDLPYYVKGKQ